MVLVSDHGDLSDLRVRLEAMRDDTERRIVPVFGSGLSNEVLPSVRGMIDIFRRAMPTSGLDRFDEFVDSTSASAFNYQNAAAILKRAKGDSVLARCIREAVLEACPVKATQPAQWAPDIEACDRSEKMDSWTLPRGYSAFAQYYASLEGKMRGPIVTTNFDPLLEIALRQVGLDVSPFPIPMDAAPTPEQLKAVSGIPILHIHGYWTSNGTLSTAAQLTRKRPSLDGLLRETIRNSVVLVLAYSGWEDAFMGSLGTRIREANLLNAEIVWASYSQNEDGALSNDTLSALLGVPGFNLYLGIDGHEIFADMAEGAQSLATRVVAPFGYSALPVPVADYLGDPKRFVDGGQPSWRDAENGYWPWLKPTQTVYDELVTCLDNGGGGGVVAIGPLGEGKSLALRQVALKIASERPELVVLWREQGAPNISSDWLHALQSEHQMVLICSDEADLITQELVASASTWRPKGSGISWLLASHDRLWWRDGQVLRDSVRDVLFHGLGETEAKLISRAWGRYGLLPSESADVAEEYGQRLALSARTLVEGREGTLFGAVLDVRHGAGLVRRMAELLERLDTITPHTGSTTTLADVFGAICLLQDSQDKYGDRGLGASRILLAEMLSLPGVFADGKLLSLLGREAAIAIAGDRVYSRHPAIARAYVESLQAKGRLVQLCKEIGRIGGRLRDNGGVSDREYRSAYLLCRSLKSQPEALAAATGAIEGAPKLLEPRVTLCSVKRRFDGSDAAAYAAGVARHLNDFKDRGSAGRGFLSEYSIVARGEGEAFFSTGLAGLGLHDGSGYVLDSVRAGYCLVSLAKSAQVVHKQNRSLLRGVTGAAIVLLERIQGPHSAQEHLGWLMGAIDDLAALRERTTADVCQSLARSLSPVSRAALEQSGLPIDLDEWLQFGGLVKLATRP